MEESEGKLLTFAGFDCINCIVLTPYDLKVSDDSVDFGGRIYTVCVLILFHFQVSGVVINHHACVKW